MAGRIVRKPTLPSKPHPDFPLTPHRSGKWCKKVQGRLYYFGSHDDPEAAVAEWLARKDGIFAGWDDDRLESGEGGDDVGELCNLFLEAKQRSVDAGELAKRTFGDYTSACDRFVDHFGARRKLTTLGPKQFAGYRNSFPKDWGSHTVNGHLARVKTLLKFAYENEVVDRPFRVGENFKRVSKRNQRLERQAKPAKLFSAGEIHALLDESDFQFNAMILLGINAGYGPADCARLTESMIDWDRSWIERLRHKTAIQQGCWLWPETIDAIRKAIANRYDNAPASLADRVFITKRRQAWFRDDEKDSPVSKQFAKIRQRALIDPMTKRLIGEGVKKKLATKQAADRWRGVGFYSLRHAFETIGGGSKDQIAVNYVMGHSDDSMAAVYREGIDPQRIVDVCQHVRAWFLEGAE